MKKYIIFVFVCLLLELSLKAQESPNENKEERIRSLEIAFISRKLNLNPEDAQRFWPIYNEYKKDVRQLAQSQRNQPDRDVLEFEQNMIDVRKKYKDQFSGAIGKDRMNQFFKAEHEFRGVLLNKIKNRPDRNEKPLMNREKRLRN